MPVVPEIKIQCSCKWPDFILCQMRKTPNQGTKQVNTDLMQDANKYYLVQLQDTVLKFAETTRVTNGCTIYY